MKLFSKSFVLMLILVGSIASLGANPPPMVNAGWSPSAPRLVYTEITVKGVEKAKPGSLVVLSPDGTEDSRHSWDIRFPIKFDEYQEENGKLFIAMPKESVGVTLFVIPNDNGKQIRKIRYTIEVEGKSEKDDKVNPEPDDKVNTKFNKSDYLVLIEESSERTPEVAKLVNSAFWLTELKSLGFNRPLINDKDSEQGKSFIEAAKLFGLNGKVPFLAIMDKDGSFIDAFEVPKSADELKGVLGL